mmetsp:Transcript_32335/g.78628  ORF Transcript_32335/g.78628 Transcript_32335/m.78628 type:complete len:128 (+) Transcript_32335:49-432(+)
MNSSYSLLIIQLLLAMVLLVPTAMPFSLSPAPLRLSSCRTRTQHLNSNRLYANGDNAAEDEAQPNAEYGVSYIGGDPCGSKYNDDPFDVQVQKPGMPDDMKARIQALVDKKVEEEKAAAEASAQSES